MQTENDDSHQPPLQAENGNWNGYKFVGDNIDKSVKPSRQRAELRGHSLHYFHGYAVKDRINLSTLSDDKPPYKEPDPEVLLPSHDDISSYRDDLEMLVARWAFVSFEIMTDGTIVRWYHVQDIGGASWSIFKSEQGSWKAYSQQALISNGMQVTSGKYYLIINKSILRIYTCYFLGS